MRLHAELRFFTNCCILNCNNNDIEIHLICELHRVHKTTSGVSVFTSRRKQVKSLGAILSVLNRKYIFFCSKHHLEFEADKFSSLCFETIKSTLGVNLGNLNYRELFYK